MTKKTRQRKNKRRSRKQSSRRKVMRQRGGKPRTNSPFLHITEDDQAIKNNFYGVFVVDRDGVEDRRTYLTRTQYENKFNEYFGQYATTPFNYTCEQITEHGIPYIHYKM